MDDIVAICRKNSEHYRDLITGRRDYEDLFSDYFDWCDHITYPREEYPYHFNKMAGDLEDLITIYLSFIADQKTGKDWREKWYTATIGAAWIHDIGMISDRDNHGKMSACFIFDPKSHFDFRAIPEAEKVKLALLCVKHHNPWGKVYSALHDWIESSFLKQTNIRDYFPESPGNPALDLRLAGKLISLADCLRYRGQGLRNDYKDSFILSYACPEHKHYFAQQLPTCTECRAEPLPPLWFFL